MRGVYRTMTVSETTTYARTIPEYLTERPQWVVHKDKEPFDPKSGRRASTTDLMTWGTFDGALSALESGKYDGLGFVFCSADPFVGFDFDHCRNPETGEVRGKVLKYIERFENAYVEVSPSGTGVHLITRGRLKDGAKRGNYEVYGQDRFFTITGVML